MRSISRQARARHTEPGSAPHGSASKGSPPQIGVRLALTLLAERVLSWLCPAFRRLKMLLGHDEEHVLVPARVPLLLHPLEPRIMLDAADPWAELSFVSAESASPGLVTIDLSLPGYQIDQLSDGQHVIAATGLSSAGDGGAPQLPGTMLRFALPPDTDLSSVGLHVESERLVSVAGQYDIAPAPFAATGTEGAPALDAPAGSEVVDGRSLAIYGVDATYDAQSCALVSTQQMGRWKMAEVYYSPFAYNPVAGALTAAEAMTLELTYSGNDPLPSDLFSYTALDDEAAGLLANFNDAQNWYVQPAGNASVEPQASQVADYVIITTSAIESGSTKLSDFVSHKQTRGYTVEVVTEGTWGGGTGDTAAENIRTWLASNYATMGIEYVLLIGNPNPDSGDVPMKMTSPRSAQAEYGNSPTDYYYADLTSNWDSDADGVYGEWGQDFSSKPMHEVLVGRIPEYGGGYADLDSILQKTIDYEVESDITWRENVLLPMAVSNYANEDNDGDPRCDGHELAEYIISDIVTPQGYSTYTLFEKEGLSPVSDACDAPITQGNVRGEWAATPYGVVDWWGHGSSQSTYRKYWAVDDGDNVPESNVRVPPATGQKELTWAEFFTSSDAASLNDDYPSVVVQVSCNNGRPEDSSNLGYSLLVNGAIATYSASRVSWYAAASWQPSFGTTYGDNASYAYYITRRLAENETTETTAAALQWCRESFGVAWNETSWMNATDFNLYGDPTIMLGATGGNGSISGSKWYDVDGDRVRDAGEPALAGWQIFLDTNGNHRLDTGEGATTTDVNGNYSFNYLVAGTYQVAEVQQPGWDFTYPTTRSHTVALGIGQAVTGINFGNQGTGTISGLKWNDIDGNGDRDGGEPGLEGWVIYLDQDRDGVRDANEHYTTTGASGGRYAFSGLPPDTYYVAEELQPTWVRTHPGGARHQVTLGPGDTAANVNFGNWQPITIQGTKWEDRDGDGVRDGDEPPLSGWTIFLDNDGDGQHDTGELSTTTNSSGAYSFANLPNATYTVAEVIPAGWTQTLPGTGSYTVTPNPGDIVTLDFGNQGTGSIEGTTWYDASGDGVFDPTEEGQGGWTLWIDQDGDGRIDGNETRQEIYNETLGDPGIGQFEFPALPPGTYRVAVMPPSGWTLTTPWSRMVTVPSGGTVTNVDFGSWQPVEISGGMKWADWNGDGARQSNEPGLSGWVIYLDDNQNGQRDGGELNTTTDGNGAFAFTQIPAGTYVVAEELQSGWEQTYPGGAGTHTVTVNAGQSVAVSFGNRGTNEVQGTKWNDIDGDGAQGGSEPGLPGWQIFVDFDRDGARDTGEPFATTDANGAYTIVGVPPGTHRIDEQHQGGWTQSYPTGGYHTVTVNDNDTVTDIHFGNWRPSEIRGVKWEDRDGDGVRDADEPGLQGWTVYLDLDDDGQLDTGEPSTVTSASGSYSFPNVQPGIYAVAEIPQGGWTQTFPASGTHTVTINPGDVASNTNFGNQGTGQIEGTKWNDLNGDQNYDTGEPGLAGWTIYIDRDNDGLLDTNEAWATTDADGDYVFDAVGPGTHVVREQLEPQWTQTYPTGGIHQVSLTPGQAVADINFGNWQPAGISGKKWHDLDGDRVYDGAIGVFGSPSAFGAGQRHFGLALGHLNGGGALDVVTANFGGNNVSTLMGAGNGTFNTHRAFNTSTEPRDVVLGHLNSDGRLDAVVANASGSVSVLRGYGDGRFQSQWTFGVGAAQTAVALDDLDGDGDLDIVATHGTAEVSVLLGNGSASFGSRIGVATGGVNSFAAALGDLDSDGVVDIVTANGPANSVSILLGAGNGTFSLAPQPTVAVGDYPCQVELGDVDGNGALDIVVLNQQSHNVSVLLGAGNGTFAPEVAYSVAYGNWVRDLALGDVNGDSALDIVCAVDTGASVLLGSASGTFGPPMFFDVGFQTGSLDIGDLNSDGRIDIVVGSYNGTNVAALLGDGEPLLQGWTIYLDQDQDGQLDPGELSTVTGADGSYSFPALESGTYTVAEQLQSDWIQMYPIGGTHTVTLTPGQYEVDVDFGNRGPGEIQGLKWNDLNGDGAQDPGEPGIQGWAIYLDQNQNDRLDTGETYATTDVNGQYTIDGLLPGTYTVAEVLLRNWQQNYPTSGTHSVTVGVGATVTDIDFGNWLPASIQGLKWEDWDGNGLRNGNEPVLEGWTIFLDENLNGTLDTGETSTTTDASGQYSFADLPAGTHTVAEVLPAGWRCVYPTAGTHTVTLVAGQLAGNRDFGNRGTGEIRGSKFNDLDADGVWDPGEPGLEDWVVYLDQNADGSLGANERSATTDASGNYAITGLPPDTYTVREVAQSHWRQSYPTTPVHTVPLNPDAIVTGMNFGNWKTGEIRGVKWHDENVNALRETQIKPDLVFVIDVSGSTDDFFGGVDDVNDDGFGETILDAELAGFIELNNGLNDIRDIYDFNPRAGVVVFGSGAEAVDMDLGTSGMQLAVAPDLDTDGNGTPEVEERLRWITRSRYHMYRGGTYFEDALQATITTFTGLGTLQDQGTMVFLSDGRNNGPGDFTDEVASLRARGYTLRAFGVGPNASLDDLRKIDPDAEIVLSTNDLITELTGLVNFLEPGLAGTTIYLDLNNNGTFEQNDEPWTLTRGNDPNTPIVDDTGLYRFTDLAPGTYTVREVVPQRYLQTAPATTSYTITVGSAETVRYVDFGNVRSDGKIQGRKWGDRDGDAQWDPGEPPFAGWTIYLDENQNGQLDAGERSTVTQPDGKYVFHDLLPGTYVVSEELNAGWTPTAPVAGANPVALWRFEEATGTAAEDSTSHDNDGTIYGSATWSSDVSTSAPGASSLSLDGADDYVSVSDDDSLDLTNQGTVQLWMKASSSLALAEGTSLVTKMSNTNSVSYDVRMASNGTLNAYVNDGSVTDATSYPVDLRDDTWHHVAFTWDQLAGVKLYVDGAQRDQAGLTGSGAQVSSWDLWIGRARYAPTSQFHYFQGLLDEIAIYDYARSSTEILADFQEGCSYTVTLSPGETMLNLNFGNRPEDPPVAADDTYSTREDQILRKWQPSQAYFGVLDNDTYEYKHFLDTRVVTDVSNGTLLLNRNGSFSYEPDENFVGPTDTFTYEVFDGVATSNTATVTINITSLNDAPTLTEGGDKSVLENRRDRAPQTYTYDGWATNISVGPQDEIDAGQQLTGLTVINNNNALFDPNGQPLLTLDPSDSTRATLTFTPATDARGRAEVTVYVSDDGGTANGGRDTSGGYTFTVSVMEGTPGRYTDWYTEPDGDKVTLIHNSLGGRFTLGGVASNVAVGDVTISLTGTTFRERLTVVVQEAPGGPIDGAAIASVSGDGIGVLNMRAVNVGSGGIDLDGPLCALIARDIADGAAIQARVIATDTLTISARDVGNVTLRLTDKDDAAKVNGKVQRISAWTWSGGSIEAGCVGYIETTRGSLGATVASATDILKIRCSQDLTGNIMAGFSPGSDGLYWTPDDELTSATDPAVNGDILNVWAGGDLTANMSATGSLRTIQTGGDVTSNIVVGADDRATDRDYVRIMANGNVNGSIDASTQNSYVPVILARGGLGSALTPFDVEADGDIQAVTGANVYLTATSGGSINQVTATQANGTLAGSFEADGRILRVTSRGSIAADFDAGQDILTITAMTDLGASGQRATIEAGGKVQGITATNIYADITATGGDVIGVNANRNRQTGALDGAITAQGDIVGVASSSAITADLTAQTGKIRGVSTRGALGTALAPVTFSAEQDIVSVRGASVYMNATSSAGSITSISSYMGGGELRANLDAHLSISTVISVGNISGDLDAGTTITRVFSRRGDLGSPGSGNELQLTAAGNIQTVRGKSVYIDATTTGGDILGVQATRAQTGELGGSLTAQAGSISGVRGRGPVTASFDAWSDITGVDGRSITGSFVARNGTVSNVKAVEDLGAPLTLVTMQAVGDIKLVSGANVYLDAQSSGGDVTRVQARSNGGRLEGRLRALDPSGNVSLISSRGSIGADTATTLEAGGGISTVLALGDLGTQADPVRLLAGGDITDVRGSNAYVSLESQSGNLGGVRAIGQNAQLAGTLVAAGDIAGVQSLGAITATLDAGGSIGSVSARGDIGSAHTALAVTAAGDVSGLSGANVYVDATSTGGKVEGISANTVRGTLSGTLTAAGDITGVQGRGSVSATLIAAGDISAVSASFDITGDLVAARDIKQIIAGGDVAGSIVSGVSGTGPGGQYGDQNDVLTYTTDASVTGTISRVVARGSITGNVVATGSLMRVNASVDITGDLTAGRDGRSDGDTVHVRANHSITGNVYADSGDTSVRLLFARHSLGAAGQNTSVHVAGSIGQIRARELYLDADCNGTCLIKALPRGSVTGSVSAGGGGRVYDGGGWHEILPGAHKDFP